MKINEMTNRLSDTALEELGGEDYQAFRNEVSRMRPEDITDLAAEEIVERVAAKWKKIFSNEDHPFWLEKYSIVD